MDPFYKEKPEDAQAGRNSDREQLIQSIDSEIRRKTKMRPLTLRPIIKKNISILGIDPGLTGALAVVDTSAHLLDIYDMPSYKRTIGRTRRRLYDTAEFARVVKELKAKHKLVCAAVERVGASPQMGVTSAFSFGHGYGIIHGVLEACNIHVIPVEPSVWKRGLGKDKSNSIFKARDTFIFEGEDDKVFPNSKDGRAEAALIAWHVLNVEAW